jgi:hypothetical protein
VIFLGADFFKFKKKFTSDVLVIGACECDATKKLSKFFATHNCAQIFEKLHSYSV